MQDGAFARRVLQALIGQGIFVRMPGVAPLDRCIRISAGTKSDLDALEAAFPKALQVHTRRVERGRQARESDAEAGVRAPTSLSFLLLPKI